MKKLVYLFVSAFVFSLALGAAPVKAAEYNWKLAHEELPGGFMDAIATEFAKRLADKSNGRIELGIFHSSTLGTHEDMVELVQNNAIQFNFAVQPGARTRAAYRLDINEYMGVESVQAMVEHLE